MYKEVLMGAVKKATVYVNPDLHKAARVHAAESDISLSDVVNEALAAYFVEMNEDIDDLKDLKKRSNEPRVSMEKILQKLKADGVI
jgi:hypothetical protein